MAKVILAIDADKAALRAAYSQAIADLEQIEGLSDAQIQNNLGDIIRKRATIEKKLLRFIYKRMIS